jgi:hypothetical protein
MRGRQEQCLLGCWGDLITMEREYIIYCDESVKDGCYYSDFYGGLIVSASQLERLNKLIKELKDRLNLFKELKWIKVSKAYLNKYIEFIKGIFNEVRAGNIKVRIMFRQNAHSPSTLTPYQVENRYYLLYYQLIKHAFGLECIQPRSNGTRIRIYLDQMPDTEEKKDQFKGYLRALQRTVKLRKSRIIIESEDIVEVDSHNHVLLQFLDIVLGAMAFRLNDLHKVKTGGSRRGNRTIAKEKLYKTILSEIRKIHSGFNIGVTTAVSNSAIGRFTTPYYHWRFIADNSTFDANRTKGGQKKT